MAVVARQVFAIERVGKQRVRVQCLGHRKRAAKALLRRLGVQADEQHADRVVNDSGLGEHVAQRHAHPFAVAHAPGHPLGARGLTPLHQAEHGAVVAGAFQVADERAAGQLADVVVAERSGGW